ncbi:amidohydrolase family protein [Actinomadura sp. PM05-2]|uniref:Amidohydrolase family protein n=2 Tax=Actinomadura parmotrematis TaxID=2864039 RepID=A0ABS7G3C3_9ACTN|nr:amidohydrolase family protein [Actinomadura parmotrematis]
MCIPEWNRREFIRSTLVAGAAAAAVPVLAAPARAAVAPRKIALTNVRVFDGTALSAPRTVVIDNGLIGLSPLGAEQIDGGGATLLPGLIDSHVHLENRATLDALASYGVTTALDMGCFPPATVDALRHQQGATDIRSAGTPGVAPGSLQSQIPTFPASGIVNGPGDALRFVSARVAESSDYIKVIVDVPGLDQPTLTAIALAAHGFGKQVMAHATTAAAAKIALAAGIDMIHHVPLDAPLDAATVSSYRSRGAVAVPTLTMMEGFANLGIPGYSYASAESSVGALRRAGVPILAGTDANHTPGVPVHPAYGDSLHHELELLVAAGLGTAEALRSATSAPAQRFGLRDRGAVRPGYRADLVLVGGDPIADIRATRDVQRVWLAGVEHAPAS